MAIKVICKDGVKTVSFLDIKEGEWFENEGGKLGVKVDGKGFYPGCVGTQMRGIGNLGFSVRRVPNVLIQERCR